jgi:hypothetical protein
MAEAFSRKVSAEEGVEELLCSILWQFRLALEVQAEKSVTDMDVPVTLFLSDFCRFLSLSEEQYDRVLGEDGVAFVNDFLATRWRLKTRGRGNSARKS